jgi:hypothetical protein
MWVFYISSYYFFQISLAVITFSETWKLFHGAPYFGVIFNSMQNHDVNFALLIFLLIPICVSLLYFFLISIIAKFSHSNRLVSFISTSGSYEFLRDPSLFSEYSTYGGFLKSHFSNEKNLLSDLGAVGFQGCKISRVYKGGSGAITAIVQSGDCLSIRKVSSATKRDSLKAQYDWLLSSSSAQLPIVDVNEWTENQTFCFYVMPYELGAVDMFEWSHAVSFQQSKLLLLDLLESIAKFHLINMNSVTRLDLLDSYISDKCNKNVITILEYFDQLINLQNFRINGEIYSFCEWNFLLDPSLSKTFIYDTSQTCIHGDLTLENIIIGRRGNWFLIDPNPSYIYRTQLMDWGKLLQSLHMGYEFLSTNINLSFSENTANFSYKRSDRYENLFQLVLQEIEGRFGKEGLKEAYFHEIIHYLRLLPYKFKEGDNQALIYFCVTCMIIREFRETYGIN